MVFKQPKPEEVIVGEIVPVFQGTMAQSPGRNGESMYSR